MKQVKQISRVAFYHLNLLNLKSAINIKGYTKLVVNSVLPIYQLAWSHENGGVGSIRPVTTMDGSILAARGLKV